LIKIIHSWAKSIAGNEDLNQGFNKKGICRCEERSAKRSFALRQSSPLVCNGIASSGKERRIRNDNLHFVKALDLERSSKMWIDRLD
jgi:hypothetical protein